MSADTSPIEHVWDELDNRMRNRIPPPANVARLKCLSRNGTIFHS